MSAQLVKELRERTGAGIVDCLSAIKEANGDIEKAIAILQEKGIAKAAKKAGAIASEGIVSVVRNNKKVVIFEVNSQTDFVVANNQFKILVDKISKALLDNEFVSIEEANEILFENKTINDLCIEATSKIGEKIILRRAQIIKVNSNESVGIYVHNNKKIAAIIILNGGDEIIAKNIAMHVASMNPQFLDEKFVPIEKINALKTEIEASPNLQGKPENIKANIVAGMLRKRLSELTLVDQEFVMEKLTVSKYLELNDAKAISMIRFEVAEGIEKQKNNFAEEVKAQISCK